MNERLHYQRVHCTGCGHAVDYAASLDLRNLMPCPMCDSPEQFGVGGRAQLERPDPRPEYRDATCLGDIRPQMVRVR